MNLSHLKEIVLEQTDRLLKNKTSQDIFEGVRYETKTLELDIPFTSHFFPLLETSPSGFWQDKEQKRKSFFMGSHKTFHHLSDEGEIEELLSKHPKLELMGGANFFNTQAASSEWRELREFFFFIPMIQLDFLDESKSLNCKINFPREIFIDKTKKESFLKQLASLFPPKNDNSAPLPKGIKDVFYPGQSHWCHSIEEAVNEIKLGRFEKIVMARKKVTYLDQKPSLKNIMNSLEKAPKGSFLIYLKFSAEKFFISQTPERLFKRDNTLIEMDSIAGTRPRGIDKDQDLILENELKASQKDLQEHRIVSNSILENLQQICDQIEVTKKETVLKLEYVQHIYTALKGTLKSNITDFNLIKTLHPTPAVGGKPWKKVINYLKRHEGFERGLYASPIGILSKNKSEFAVGIRSALFNLNQVHIYSGAGIVSESLGEEEWMETKTKMSNMESILVP